MSKLELSEEKGDTQYMDNSKSVIWLSKVHKPFNFRTFSYYIKINIRLKLQ